MSNLPPIPHVEAVQDGMLKQILSAMRIRIHGLIGLGREEDRALTYGDARGLGMLGRNPAGKWYARAVKEDATMTDQAAKVRGSSGTVGQVIEVSAELECSGLEVGDHELSGLVLPSGAVVTHAWYDVLEAVTSGELATIALSIPTDHAAGLLAASAIGVGFTAGYHSGIPDGTTPATFTNKTTAERTVTAVVATADLTAGRFRLFIRYTISE